MFVRIREIFYHHQQHRLRAGWRLLVHFMVTALLMFGSYIALAVIAYFARVPPEAVSFFYVASVLQSAILITTVFLASWLLDRRRLRDLGIDRLWRIELVVGFAAGLIAMLGIFAIQWVMGWIAIDRVGTSETMTALVLAKSQASWLLLMILVGASEELISRGYHLKNLSEGLRRLGAWRSVVVASICSLVFFGSLHALNPSASWISTLSVTLAGLMFATGRIATGSLAAPIGLHISWNLFQGPILGFPVSGNTTANSFLALTQRGDPFWTGGEFGPEAGVLGVAATLSLLAMFVVWGRRKNCTTKNVAQLTHFRDRRRASAAATGHANSIEVM